MDFEESREMGAAPEVIWRLVSDAQRLAEWVPTTTSSQPKRRQCPAPG
jgi:carbon monoxide dehydrogenase subunit G